MNLLGFLTLLHCGIRLQTLDAFRVESEDLEKNQTKRQILGTSSTEWYGSGTFANIRFRDPSSGQTDIYLGIL